MPFVEIKVVDGVFDSEEKAALVQEVTEAVVRVEGEALRGSTFVTVQSVASGEWGIGGRLMTAADIRAIRGTPSLVGS